MASIVIDIDTKTITRPDGSVEPLDDSSSSSSDGGLSAELDRRNNLGAYAVDDYPPSDDSDDVQIIAVKQLPKKPLIKGPRVPALDVPAAPEDDVCTECGGALAPLDNGSKQCQGCSAYRVRIGGDKQEEEKDPAVDDEEGPLEFATYCTYCGARQTDGECNSCVEGCNMHISMLKRTVQQYAKVKEEDDARYEDDMEDMREQNRALHNDNKTIMKRMRFYEARLRRAESFMDPDAYRNLSRGKGFRDTLNKMWKTYQAENILDHE